jgi:hypothetical protein
MIYNGYTKVRNGIFEHLHSGKITPLDCTLYLIILSQCDFETGVWYGSAFKLMDAVHGTITKHKARGFLRKFVGLGWLKPFKNQSAHKATVTYLVDKFEASSGRNQGARVDALLTTDWKSPVYSKRNSTPDQDPLTAVSPQELAQKAACLNTKTNTNAEDEDLEPEGMNEGKPLESVPSETQAPSPAEHKQRTQRCAACDRGAGCYKHPAPVQPQTPVAATPLIGSDAALELCDYAVKALNETGIPKKDYPQEWVTRADELLTFNDDPSPEGMQFLKDCFLFARQNSHFGKYTSGIPDFVRFYMNDADKGLKFQFYNSRRKAEKEPSKAPPAKQPKFKGETI